MQEQGWEALGLRMGVLLSFFRVTNLWVIAGGNQSLCQVHPERAWRKVGSGF